jgi:hypothetical protein
MKIFLAGSVPKGDKEAENWTDWRKIYIEKIKKIVGNVELFDPNIFYALEGDSKAVAGADSWHIKQSDLVIINGQEKLGAGTAMEILIAKYFKRPVIVILPKNSHHRRSKLLFEGKTVDEWIHPFIDSFADIILENIDEFSKVPGILAKAKIKDITEIDKVIEYARKRLTEE